MNRDPILFRVDAGPRTSYEHLARCATYAAALQRRRRPTYFLSQLEPRSLALPIKRAGNEWLDADAPVGTEEDLTETIQEIRRLRPAAVIVDAPTFTADYLNEIQATGVLLVSIDHAAGIRFPSQVLINPLLGPGKETYEFAPGTQLLLGPRYALVRSEVRRQRPNRAQEPPPVPSPNGKVASLIVPESLNRRSETVSYRTASPRSAGRGCSAIRHRAVRRGHHNAPANYSRKYSRD